jgi:plastocyanin
MRKLAAGIVLVSVVAALAVAAEAAAIRGVVQLGAAPAESRKVPVTIDQYVCGTEKDAEELAVGRDGGVRNVVVWLETPPKGEPAPAKVEMDQKACVFAPRVVIVPVGGTVDFLNSDRLLHNLHSVSRENPSFNRTQPKGRTIPVTFSRPEFVRIDCDLHSWMRGWVVVADHAFYALTDAAGEFALPPVPPGKYVLKVWHETLGTTTREVTVGAQDARVTIPLKARR